MTFAYQSKMIKMKNTIINRLKTGWTTLKLVRVGLGSLILYTSITSGQVTGMLVGSLLLIVALFTNGVCCISRSCAVQPVSKNNNPKIETIEYEELDQ